MLRMGKETKRTPAEVVEEAVKFFGPSGLGMSVMDQDDCCAQFEGAGGYVTVRAADRDDKRGSDVTVVGRESEYQIKQFVADI